MHKQLLLIKEINCRTSVHSKDGSSICSVIDIKSIQHCSMKPIIYNRLWTIMITWSKMCSTGRDLPQANCFIWMNWFEYKQRIIHIYYWSHVATTLHKVLLCVKYYFMASLLCIVCLWLVIASDKQIGLVVDVRDTFTTLHHTVFTYPKLLGPDCHTHTIQRCTTTCKTTLIMIIKELQKAKVV